MSKITEKTCKVYTTTDGKEFNDAIEAEGHQAALDCTASVEAFIVEEHADSKERHRGTLRKLIASWEAFKVKHPVTTDDATAADAAE